MAVTFTLNEVYTGLRTVELPPAEPGGSTTTEEVATNKVEVAFTDGTITFIRDVNVCFDEAGQYDEAATLVRCEEVALGIEKKLLLGVIKPSTSHDPANP